MKIFFSRPFERDYKNLTLAVQKILDKQLEFLQENPRHPSLRIKKMEGSHNIWEGRITKDHRFTFEIVGPIYYMRRTGNHKILNNP